MSKLTLLFVGGGSGGHIAPLLAVMEAVHAQDPEAKLIYVGTQKDAVSPLVRESAVPFEVKTISAGKLHRFFSLDQAVQGGRFVAGLFQADALLRTVKPDLVFSKGGMVGVPLALAAARRKIPLYSHETDAAPGLANRIVGRYARSIFTAFPAEGYVKLPEEKLVYTGQPVRSSFYTVDRSWKRLVVADRELVRTGTPLVTVLCGSQGSRQINTLVQQLWPSLLAEARLVHITGPGEFQELRLNAAALPVELRANLYLVDFVTSGLPELLVGSELVIGRSGGTVFEMAACRVPALLIPLDSAAQNHQWLNADILQRAQAARVMAASTLTPQLLLDSVRDLLLSKEKRQALTTAISTFDKPQAASDMASLLLASLRSTDKTPETT